MNNVVPYFFLIFLLFFLRNMKIIYQHQQKHIPYLIYILSIVTTSSLLWYFDRTIKNEYHDDKWFQIIKDEVNDRVLFHYNFTSIQEVY